jgi:hypothetical protein
MSSFPATLSIDPPNANGVSYGQSVTSTTSALTSHGKYQLPNKMSPAPYWQSNSQLNYSITPLEKRANSIAMSQPTTSYPFRQQRNNTVYDTQQGSDVIDDDGDDILPDGNTYTNRRNLSISRSGRHKVKARQRQSILAPSAANSKPPICANTNNTLPSMKRFNDVTSRKSDVVLDKRNSCSSTDL